MLKQLRFLFVKTLKLHLSWLDVTAVFLSSSSSEFYKWGKEEGHSYKFGGEARAKGGGGGDLQDEVLAASLLRCQSSSHRCESSTKQRTFLISRQQPQFYVGFFPSHFQFAKVMIM